MLEPYQILVISILSQCTMTALQINIFHHEQNNKKTTSQIKFSAITIKQRIKLVLRHSLCKNEFNVLVQELPLHIFIYSISCLVK